jgi:hypothetical protein
MRSRMVVPVSAVTVLLILMTIGTSCSFDAAPSPTPTPSQSPDCGRPRAFSDSCEGVWLRAVVGEAGYSINGEGSTAWSVVAGKNEFYLWATGSPKEPDLEKFLDREGYGVHHAFDQGVVHSSSLRYVWATQGLLVWIGEPSRKVTSSVLTRLLDASLRTPYPPPLPNSSP